MSRLIGAALLGVGGLLGICGAGVMVAGRRKKTNDTPVPKDDQIPDSDTETEIESDSEGSGPQSQAPPPVEESRDEEVKGVPMKYTVLGTKTRYLTERHPVHNSLYQLSTYLVKSEERHIFNEAVSYVDNILALSCILNNGQATGIASLPDTASIFNERLHTSLKAIVEFSAATMPSKTKREQMTNACSDATKIIDDMIHNMYRTLASVPLDRIARD